MANVLDANLVNGEFTRIRRTLNIRDGGNRVAGWFSVHYLILLQTLVIVSDVNGLKNKGRNPALPITE